MSAWSARSGRLAQRPAARPGRHRRPLRLRHPPPDRLAEPAASATCRTISWCGTRSTRRPRPGLARQRICAAAWSPAPAMPAANSPPRDTKRHAAALADWLEARITIDQPINIHLTGCHHSCAQHYVADIGLLATKVEQRRGPRSKATTCSSAAAPGQSRNSAGWCATKWCSTTCRLWCWRMFRSLAGRSAGRDLPGLHRRPVGRRSPPLRRARARDGRMNAVSPPIPLIPENAPFSPAQRAWLNGFLAGLYGGATSSGLSIGTPPGPEPEDFPWHDPDPRTRRAHDARRGQAAQAIG